VWRAFFDGSRSNVLLVLDNEMYKLVCLVYDCSGIHLGVYLAETSDVYSGLKSVAVLTLLASLDVEETKTT
jgi:hypothetical protein